MAILLPILQVTFFPHQYRTLHQQAEEYLPTIISLGFRLFQLST